MKQAEERLITTLESFKQQIIDQARQSPEAALNI
jgi:hypothetical protein